MWVQKRLSCNDQRSSPRKRNCRGHSPELFLSPNKFDISCGGSDTLIRQIHIDLEGFEKALKRSGGSLVSLHLFLVSSALFFSSLEPSSGRFWAPKLTLRIQKTSNLQRKLTEYHKTRVCASKMRLKVFWSLPGLHVFVLGGILTATLATWGASWKVFAARVGVCQCHLGFLGDMSGDRSATYFPLNFCRAPSESSFSWPLGPSSGWLWASEPTFRTSKPWFWL